MTSGQLHNQSSAGSLNLRRVFVRDLELMARVGVYEVERRYEQRIILSVDLFVTDDYDGVSDKLRDVFDYGAVVKDVQTVVEAEHVHLLETLAERISRNCLADHARKGPLDIDHREIGAICRDQCRSRMPARMGNRRPRQIIGILAFDETGSEPGERATDRAITQQQAVIWAARHFRRRDGDGYCPPVFRNGVL